MKFIFKTALGTLLGIFIFLFISICLIFFISFILIPKNIIEKRENSENSILEIKLSDIIMNDNKDNFSFFDLNSSYKISLEKIIQTIKFASFDKNIKGIILELNELNGGINEIRDIRHSLEDFKNSKKFIYAYGDKYSQSAYYLGSIADLIFLNPLGGIDFKGLSIENIFYKNLSNKIGLNFYLCKYGNYKSAMEPYTNYKMSSENKTQKFRLINNIWKDIINDIGISRKISNNKLNNIADKLSGMLAESAYKNSLVDKLFYHDDFINFIKLKYHNINKISFVKYIDFIFRKKQINENNIALFYANGSIYHGNGTKDIQDLNYKNIINSIINDNSIKAVVLRINSPGGDVLASNNIYRDLLRLKKIKPLIISFGEQAASGAYYISLAGNQIVSSPNSITGSIGVFGLIPDGSLFSKKIGITTDNVITNKNSNIYSFFSGINKEYKKYIEKNIEMIYKNFIKTIVIRRKISFDKVKNISQGKIWTGKEALYNGLVDKIGNIDDAIKLAAVNAKIKNYNIIEIPEKKSLIETFKKIYNSEDIKIKIKEEILSFLGLNFNFVLKKQIKDAIYGNLQLKNDIVVKWSSY